MLIADTHVHFYPSYDAAAALTCANKTLRSLGRTGTTVSAGLFLTERFDCFFYRDLISGRFNLPGYSITPTSETGAVVLENPSANISLLLVAGRQIVTADGIEVLALTADADIPDRQPTDSTLAHIRDAGAVPVLSWAPGKWLGRRGAIIRHLIDQAARGALALGDTSLRPIGWPTPALIQRGRAKGIPVLAGSDPLPIDGEESVMGSYAVCFDCYDETRPVSSIREAIRSGTFTLAGRRNSLPVMMNRWIANQRTRKTPS
jgi:hypothetical protein